MKGISFFKKAVFWPVAFVCILSIGSATAPFGYQPAGAFTDRVCGDQRQGYCIKNPVRSGAQEFGWKGPR